VFSDIFLSTLLYVMPVCLPKILGERKFAYFGASRAKCAYVNAELEAPALVYLGSMANPQLVVLLSKTLLALHLRTPLRLSTVF
jgi:hypothetical protein